MNAPNNRSDLERAEEYARLLDVGSEIIDDTDGPVVEPFRHLLPAVLFLRKRLYLDRHGDREVVTSTPPWLSRRLRGETERDLHATERAGRVICRKCNRPAFDCEHELMLVVSGIEEPMLPFTCPRGAA